MAVIKPKESSTYLKHRASVIFARPSFRGKAQGGGSDGMPPMSCFDACFGMLLGFPSSNGGTGAGFIHHERKALGPVPMHREWADLPEEKRSGLQVEVCSSAKESVEGWENQDSALACLPAGCGGGADGKNSMFLFGVYDGHGRYGHEVSAIAASRLPGHLSSGSTNPAEAPDKALKEAVAKTDEDIYAGMGPDVEYSGSTGVIALLDQGKKLLTVANIGDSRAILAQQHGGNWSALPLTTDLKPDHSEERERIELSGGIVAQYKEADGTMCGPYRVWDAVRQEKPGLAVSRSLGDGAARMLGVISDPLVTSHQLTQSDRFMLIASDGLWDSISNDDAVRIVAKFLHMPSAGLKALTEYVRREEGDELVDDTTILLVIFA
eukprot:TRINITY_DN93484_c0_g1_i1.p1 TRINITY_DN93484_c0_g1~~TRINITY_DN93484_c0_g1_i1.p1  ORF type:complete len:380 (+),score=71.96 TRINITY_DN93484_c0_g1_i1:69-1208(+)